MTALPATKTGPEPVSGLSAKRSADAADRFVEQPAPAQLASDEVTLLHVYGSLQFAGARTLQVLLPDPAGATRPVVILRLRLRGRGWRRRGHG